MGARTWLAAALLLWPLTAGAADIEWKLSKKDGRAYLTGMPKVSEVDYELWAHCRADGTIEVGAGAESHVGRGNSEAVALQFAAGLKRATLSGISRESENVEMTGGVELRTIVERTHPLFAVLANGSPIKVTGRIKPITWPVNGLKAKVAEFLKACK